MIENLTIRKYLHYLFIGIYTSARSVYLILKFTFRPIVYLHPRLYNFSIMFREAIKALISPPVIHPEIIPPPHLDDRPEMIPESPVEPEIIQAQIPERIPSWVIEEWREIHDIEPQIFPETWLIETIPFYQVPASRLAVPYLELCDYYGKDVSHVFLVPWLVTGGADLVTINYIRSLTDQPDMRHDIVLIATLNFDSPWKKRLPETVRFIEFGKRFDFLTPEEQEKLLVRLLLQKAPKVIHNINSELGYRVFVKYGHALKEFSKLYASSFCFDLTEQGRKVGYAAGYLPKCFDLLEAVLSDNQAHLDQLEEIYAFDKEKMVVHYQPTPHVPLRKQYRGARLNKGYLDVLWAGRLDRQKRPDLLIEIARKSGDLPIRFHVYGTPLLNTETYTDAFEEAENILFYGSFDGLPSLPIEEYNLLLYTSQWDGLPNVLLEAIALRLPVVASDVGGVSEIIHHYETGFLVRPYDDTDQYADYLNKIYNDPSVLPIMADNAYRLAASRHSWEAFNDCVRNTPYYSR